MRWRAGGVPVAACVRPLVALLLLAAAVTAALALCRSAGAAILLSGVALFGADLASSCGWALAAVATDGEAVATLDAVQNVGGSVGGAPAPMLAGLLVQATGSFRAALLTGAAVAVASALAYALGPGGRRGHARAGARDVSSPSARPRGQVSVTAVSPEVAAHQI